MPDDKEKDEFLTAPIEDTQRTTPYKTPQVSGETPPELPAGSLHTLRQRYDILAEVGRGGMGIVYKARDRETGAVVALKVLRPEIAADTAVIERFKSELLLARKITHKNVCRVYDLGRFGDIAAISMEYVEGQSLRATLEAPGGVSLRRGLAWVRQICQALAEAHTQGVVHRDLKPENILITRDGGVRVMDFGIARSIEAAATKTTGIIGTPAYMSPEQSQGKPVDARSDIYSLGLIMYEMFAGQPAFKAETPVGLAYKQVHEKPEPARSLDPYLPPFLDRAIEKCSEKDPKKRFQSVAQLESALEEQSVVEPAEFEDPKPAPHLSVWGKRDWALLVLGVLGLVYFLEFRNTVFPAATKPLEVDAVSARRIADELATRMGRPFPSEAQVQLLFKGEEYADDLIRRGSDWRGDLRTSLPQTELPLYWRVTFSSPSDVVWGADGAPERHVLVDRKGQVQEFSHPYTPGWLFPNYQPPPVEERRRVAREAFERVCGPLPSNWVPIETSGGEQAASYAVTWRPRPLESPPEAEVSLRGENLVALRCKLPSRIMGPNDPLFILRWFGKFFRNLCWIFMLPFAVATVVFFGIGQCYRSPLLWRRAPLAAALGLAGVWLLAPIISQLPNSGIAGSPPSLPLLVGGGAAAAGLILVGLVTAEHYLLRRTPASVATYVMVSRGRLGGPSVGLGVLRGAVAGLVLAGTETLMQHLGVVLSPNTHEINMRLLAPHVDPTVLDEATGSISPALFVVSAALFSGLIIGVILMGSAWALSKDSLKYRAKPGGLPFVAFGVGSVALLFVVALRLPLGQAFGVLGIMLAPSVLLFLTGYLLLSYDVLTATVAVATVVLWTLNFPLLEVFKDLGNSGQWAVFTGWGLLVAAAAAVAFRSGLARHLQRAKAEMQ